MFNYTTIFKDSPSLQTCPVALGFVVGKPFNIIANPPAIDTVTLKDCVVP